MYLASHRGDVCGPRSWWTQAVGKGSARQGLDSACKCQMYCANTLPIEGATPNFHCLASERAGAAMLPTPPELGRDGAGASHPLRPIELPSPALACHRRAPNHPKRTLSALVFINVRSSTLCPSPPLPPPHPLLRAPPSLKFRPSPLHPFPNALLLARAGVRIRAPASLSPCLPARRLQLPRCRPSGPLTKADSSHETALIRPITLPLRSSVSRSTERQRHGRQPGTPSRIILFLFDSHRLLPPQLAAVAVDVTWSSSGDLAWAPAGLNLKCPERPGSHSQPLNKQRASPSFPRSHLRPQRDPTIPAHEHADPERRARLNTLGPEPRRNSYISTLSLHSTRRPPLPSPHPTSRPRPHPRLFAPSPL